MTHVSLPNFNPFCSARLLGAALGRAADDGVSLVAFGFDNREQLSPFMFYARRQFPEISDPALLAAQLQGRPACALMREQEYAAVAAVLPGSPVPQGTLNALRFVVVESARGVCSREPTERYTVRAEAP